MASRSGPAELRQQPGWAGVYSAAVVVKVPGPRIQSAGSIRVELSCRAGLPGPWMLAVYRESLLLAVKGSGAASAATSPAGRAGSAYKHRKGSVLVP